MRKAFAILLLALVAPPLEAGALRFRVPSFASVSGDVVFLSHLLPVDAPAAVRLAAGNVALGAAPEPGSARRFRREEIIEALRNAGACLDARSVPDTVVVRRAGRYLRPEDLVAVVAAALGLEPAPSPAEISIPGALVLAKGPEPLRVLEVRQDPALELVTVRVAPLRGSSLVPFDIVVRGAGRATAVRTVARPQAAPAAALVDPRRSARLSLTSPDARLLLSVKPLERGAGDDTVRVRLPGSGRTFRARVVGRDALEAHL